MPLMPHWRRTGKVKDRAERGAISSPKSAKLGIVCRILTMKKTGFSAMRLRVAHIPSGMPIKVPAITLLTNKIIWFQNCCTNCASCCLNSTTTERLFSQPTPSKMTTAASPDHEIRPCHKSQPRSLWRQENIEMYAPRLVATRRRQMILGQGMVSLRVALLRKVRKIRRSTPRADLGRFPGLSHSGADC